MVCALSTIEWLGWIQKFREGGFRYVPPKAVPCRRSSEILPLKIFKIEGLGNGISGILRPSQCVMMSRCFKGVRPNPLLPLDPPQSGIPISRTLELSNLPSNPLVEHPISRNTRFFKSIFISLGCSKNQCSTVQSKGPEEARTQTPRTPVIGPSIKLPNAFC